MKSLSRMIATSFGTKVGVSDSLSNVFMGTVARFVTEFRGFRHLNRVEDVRIELDNWDSLDHAVYRYGMRNKCDFDPVPFWVKEIRTGGGPNTLNLYKADLQYDVNGFVLRSNVASEGGDTLMILSLGGDKGDDARVLGRVVHPTGVTLFKICVGGNPRLYTLERATGDQSGTILFSILEKLDCRVGCAACCGLAFSPTIYVVKQADIVLAKIIPEISATDNSYRVKYRPGYGDEQTRAAILGVSMMVTLTKGYPELVQIMAEGQKRQSRKSITSEHLPKRRTSYGSTRPFTPY